MSLAKTLYNLAPIRLQEVMLSVVGYQKNRSRYGAAYHEYRKFLKAFDHYSLDEQLDYQRNELIQFIKNTVERSPFYRELYKGIDLESIQSVADLKKLPMVDKEMLRQEMANVTTISRREAVVHHTSGSTGKPFEAFLTKEDMMKRSAQLDHYKSRLQFENLNMRKASFTGQMIVPAKQTQKRFWRYNKPAKQMLYSTYHLNEENLAYYVDSLNAFKPQALDGYFSSMVLVADYIERHELTIDFQLIGIFPTAETLNASGRKLLERVFDCKVYDQYASSEGAPFVTECSHQALHMELSSGVFEHVEAGNDEVLVTSFTTHGTPLIRYRIGDLMTFEEGGIPCLCGSEAPRIKRIDGRNLDFIYTTDNRKLYSTQILGMFEQVPRGIIQAQFIQNQLDEVLLLLQTDPNTYKVEFADQIKEAFYYMFDQKTNLIIQEVDHIPREKSGKFRLIKNNIGG